ncbi:MAG TPA: RES family NAD+ phosphorylase [Acidimicrobiales bacterium]|nr:RES family NAD+ phosphorylase [Acidimicrobiales bacterium]
MPHDVKRHPDTRQTPSIGSPPPPDQLASFPVWHVHAGTRLYRVTSAGLGPWWFSSDAQGRFDLPPPRGTCYLADDAIGALLEVLGPIVVVSPGWAHRLRLWHLGLPDQCSAADTTVRAARGFGVTAELAAITPYDLPQRWAAAFVAAGHQGVRYRVRHDPSGSRALALFGAAGERVRWPRGRGLPVDDDLLALLTKQTGVRVAPVPRLADLGDVSD